MGRVGAGRGRPRGDHDRFDVMGDQREQNSRKMMTRYISLFVVALLMGLSQMQAQEMVELGPKIKTIRAAHYTEKMDLSPEEAEKFWPVFNTREKELLTIARKKKAKEQQLKNTMKINAPRVLENLIDEYANLERQEAEVRRRYHDRFKEVLPIKKVVLFYQAERSWRKRILSRILQNQQKRQQLNKGGKQ